MRFTYAGNGKPGFLVPIPRAKNYETFERSERRDKWLDKIVGFLVECNKEKIEDVYSWLLRYIYEKQPKIFVDNAVQLRLHVSQKMDHVEAAAMWMNANVSYKQAKIILSHFYAKFGHRVQVPLNQVKSIGNIPLEPIFEEFLYRKDKAKKEKCLEKIKYWTYDVQNLLEIDICRLLMTYPSSSKPTFGYNSKGIPNNFGVYCVLGSDHGAGMSRYLLRLNHESSSMRRKHENKVDFGTRTMQFAEAVCKQDVLELQQRITPVLNKAKSVLEASRLIAIRYGEDRIYCKFIPKNSTKTRTQICETTHIITLNYSCGGVEYEEKVGMRI